MPFHGIYIPLQNIGNYNMGYMNTVLSFTAEKPIFMKMAEVANFPQMSTEQQRIYMRSLNNYRTVLATKDYDLNRGIAIGRAEGEASMARSIAVNLLAMRYSIDEVSAATGLSVEELHKMNPQN